ncbi:MAG: 9-O-acetylesterase [Kiritimatiellae bacterium]|nr:9-O-acetylesterase [Kiritimatiellia bacterium]
MKRSFCIAGLCAGLVAANVSAAVSLPNIFGDNMVLQQGMAVPVWGWADPGETVTVLFAGQTRRVTADADGKWSLKLDALQATSTPSEMTVTGKNQIVFRNVVVGEVWFCSGQSNMEFKVRDSDHAQQEMAAADLPMIRHFQAPKHVASMPEKNVNARWSVTTPQNVGNESAIAFFFGRDLHRALKVPVGLINCSWGGTRIEPWTPLCGFEETPSLESILNRIRVALPGTAEHAAAYTKYTDAMKAWLNSSRAEFDAGKTLTPPPAFPAEMTLPSRPNDPQEPTVLFNGMVAGLVPFAIRGAIWYQGCSNMGEGMLYLSKTEALVKGWRKVWGQGDFPYYLVQLAPYNYGGNGKALPGIWEAQAAVPAAIPNTGYVVINDVGNFHDIHPRNKQTPSRRLADQALARTYGVEGIEWSGPVFRRVAIEGSAIRIFFDHAKGLKTRNGAAPDWFEIADMDGQFVKAEATIDGETVVIRSPEITQPVSMRFAWDHSASPNLVNGAGLPAGAFRSSIAMPFTDMSGMEELKGFRKIYDIDLPARGNSRNLKYTLDDSAKAGEFTRVAYLLQLQTTEGVFKYVMTAMDAFTKDPAKLKVPTADTKIFFQTKVSNLTVRSNLRSIPKLDQSDGGNIEFWSVNYSPNPILNLPGNDGAHYDFDDASAGTEGVGYGSMQIHSWKDKTTLWAFNNFNHGEPCDLGIGHNKEGEHRDYTFMRNGDAYKIRKLSVFVK